MHVVRSHGSVQGPELQPKPGRMLGLDARFTSLDEEGLYALVAE